MHPDEKRIYQRVTTQFQQRGGGCPCAPVAGYWRLQLRKNGAPVVNWRNDDWDDWALHLQILIAIDRVDATDPDLINRHYVKVRDRPRITAYRTTTKGFVFILESGQHADSRYKRLEWNADISLHRENLALFDYKKGGRDEIVRVLTAYGIPKETF